MLITNLRFTLYSLLLMTIQIMINNFTPIYVDLLGVFLVIILLNGEFAWRQLIILSLIADLIGHWYLGTHLCATLMVSFLIQPLVNFYLVCTMLQRIIFIEIFYILSALVIILIELIAKQYQVNLQNYLVQLIVIVPLTSLLVNSLFVRRNDNMVFNE